MTNIKLVEEMKDDEIIVVQLPRNEYRRLREMIKRDEETTALMTFVMKTAVTFFTTTVAVVTAVFTWWDNIKGFLQGLGK
jgi:hypothetical protein